MVAHGVSAALAKYLLHCETQVALPVLVVRWANSWGYKTGPETARMSFKGGVKALNWTGVAHEQ